MGTIDYNRAPITDPAFAISTGNEGASFINDGIFDVTNQPGAQLIGSTAFPTDVTISTPFTGIGTVNTTGNQPVATAPTAHVGSQAQVTIDSDSPVTGDAAADELCSARPAPGVTLADSRSGAGRQAGRRGG